MILGFLGFLHLNFIDILDILLVAILLYLALRWIRRSSAMNVFAAIFSLFLLKFIVSTMGMKMMTSIMTTVVDAGVIALVVIFQPEIRRFLMKFGRKGRSDGKIANFFMSLFKVKAGSIRSASKKELLEAVNVMSDQKTGALIVIENHDSLDYIVETGDRIDSNINSRLLLNLFFKNSPLHDGAVIISNDRIVAARCTLPVTGKSLPAKYGMRHKSAVGMSEESDAIVIVVSEETGRCSFVKDGEITPCKEINDLGRLLSENTLQQKDSGQ